MKRFLALLLVVGGPVAFSQSQSSTSQVGRVQKLAPDVYFYEGDIGKGHCNNAWIVLDDYVLVVDANFPSGAREILPKIRELGVRSLLAVPFSVSNAVAGALFFVEILRGLFAPRLGEAAQADSPPLDKFLGGTRS